LAQARRPNPSVCFVSTASGDADSYIARFYATFAAYPCRPTHLPLFGRTPDLKRMLALQDVIFVGGGNTKSMLAVWRDWGLPQLLRKAWSGRLAGLPLLGFLPGTCCPHFDSEAERRPVLQRLVATRAVPKALALDDGAAAHFVGRRLTRIVSAQPTGGGYEVRCVGSRTIETELPVIRLSQSRRLTRVAPDGRRV
jgi:peptidase E